MGQADKEIEYEDYYPPGATEPIRREKRPSEPTVEPAAEPVSAPVVEPSVAEDQAESPAPEDEYGDGVSVNEQGEKTLVFGTLNKKRRSTKKAKDSD